MESVAVVGGGAAGLITTLQLLNGPHDTGDLDVVVFEREESPYTTLCGEGISHKTLKRFGAFDSFPYVAEAFPGAAWMFPGDVTVYVDEPCYTLERSSWIPAMAKEAQGLGAEYRTGVKVSPERALELSEEFDLVVGADGPGSQVRRTMDGAEITTVLGIQYRVAESDYETDRLEFITDKRFSPEYSWVFPKGDILNVGLLAGQGGAQAWDDLDAFMEHMGVGGEIVKREAYPIGFFGNKLQEGNRVLVGDAGGLTNPVTKGGLTAIIYASDILASCIAEGEPGTYGKRVFDHPITDPSFRQAVETIERWSNEDFRKLTRFAPSEMRVGSNGSSARMKYLGPFLLTLATNLGKAKDLNTLAKAMGLSNQYSW